MILNKIYCIKLCRRKAKLNTICLKHNKASFFILHNKPATLVVYIFAAFTFNSI